MAVQQSSLNSGLGDAVSRGGPVNAVRPVVHESRRTSDGRRLARGGTTAIPGERASSVVHAATPAPGPAASAHSTGGPAGNVQPAEEVPVVELVSARPPNEAHGSRALRGLQLTTHTTEPTSASRPTRTAGGAEPIGSVGRFRGPNATAPFGNTVGRAVVRPQEEQSPAGPLAAPVAGLGAWTYGPAPDESAADPATPSVISSLYPRSLREDRPEDHPWPELPSEVAPDPDRAVIDALREAARWKRLCLEQGGSPWNA